MRAFARVRHEFYPSVIGDMKPFVLGSVLRSRGWRPFYRVRLPAQTGGEASRLCAAHPGRRRRLRGAEELSQSRIGSTR